MIITLRNKPGGYTQVVVSDSALGEGHVEFKLTSPTEVEVRDERVIDRDDWDELPEVERIAIAVWNQGSADTTQMLKAVRAAINAERRRAYEAQSPGGPMPPKLEVTEEDVAELVTLFEQRFPWFAKLRKRHGWASVEEVARQEYGSVTTGDYCTCTLDRTALHTCPVHGVCMIPGCGCDGRPHP